MSVLKVKDTPSDKKKWRISRYSNVVRTEALGEKLIKALKDKGVNMDNKMLFHGGMIADSKIKKAKDDDPFEFAFECTHRLQTLSVFCDRCDDEVMASCQESNPYCLL